MSEGFENLDNILHNFVTDKVQCSSSFSWQSRWTKPNAKMVLVSIEPLLYLEFNKPNKQNVYEINLFKKLIFSPSQNNCLYTV